MKITTGIKNAKIEYGKETFTFPLNTISYAVDDQFTGLTLFRNNERIGTAPLDQAVVDGQSLTPANVHNLLLPLFAEQKGGGVELPIEISDVNGLEEALKNISTDWAGMTFYVDGSYDGGDSTGSPLKPFKNIQSAIDSFSPVNDYDEVAIIISKYPYYYDGGGAELNITINKNVTLIGTEDTSQFNAMLGNISIVDGAKQVHLQNIQALSLYINSEGCIFTANDIYIYTDGTADTDIIVDNAGSIEIDGIKHDNKNYIRINKSNSASINNVNGLLLEVGSGSVEVKNCSFGWIDHHVAPMDALIVNTGTLHASLINCKFASYAVNPKQFRFHRIVNNANVPVVCFNCVLGEDNRKVQNVKFIGSDADLSSYLQKQKGDGTTFLSNDDTYKSINEVPSGGFNYQFLITSGTTPTWTDALTQGNINNANAVPRTISGKLLFDNLALKQDKLPEPSVNGRFLYSTNGQAIWQGAMNQINIDNGDSTPRTLSANLLRDNLNTKVNKEGDEMLGALILNGNPTTALGATTKQYVDDLVASIESSFFSFKGFISNTEPTDDLRVGLLWYNPSGTGKTFPNIDFPWSAAEYQEGGWTSASIEYSPGAGDLWANINDSSSGWYYMGDSWHILDFSGSAFNAAQFKIVDGIVTLNDNGITNNEIAPNANIEQSKIKDLTTTLSSCLVKNSSTNQGAIVNVVDNIYTVSDSNVQIFSGDVSNGEEGFSKLNIVSNLVSLERNNPNTATDYSKINVSEYSLDLEQTDGTSYTSVKLANGEVEIQASTSGQAGHLWVNGDSVPTVIGNSIRMMILTQAEYDALPSKDDSIIYFIKE